MKRFLAFIVLIAILLGMISSTATAAEINYDPVNITLLSNNVEEQSFRTWAADIIEKYYFEYAMHQWNLSEYYSAVDFPELHKFRNAIWGNQYVDLDLEHMGQFDGIYRSYYFASIAKLDYDFNISKSYYTIVRTDAETDDEYIARMKPFYKMLLIETMEDEGVIDLSSLDNVNPAKKGVYTLKEDANGNMTMQLDEDGVMGALDAMAKDEAVKAWVNFGESMIDTMLVGSQAYEKLVKNITDKKSIEDVLMEAIKTGAQALLKTYTDGVLDNRINMWKNAMKESIRCSVANKKLRDYNRTMQFLQNVYDGKDNSFIAYRSDSVFKSAVKELIDATESKYNADISALAAYAVEDIPFECVLTTDDFAYLVIMEFSKQLANIILSPIEKVLKDGFEDDKNKIRDKALIAALEFLVAFERRLIMNLYDQCIKNINAGGIKSISNDDDDDLGKEVLQSTLDTLIQVLTDYQNGKYKKDESVSTKKDKLLMDTMKAVASEMENIQEACAANSFPTDDVYGIISRILGAVFKSFQDNFGEIAFDWAYSKASSEFGKKCSALTKGVCDTAAEVLKSAVKSGASLAASTKATIDEMCDEKQTSYRAVAMASAYKASAAIEISLAVDLKLLESNYSGGIKAAILDPNATTASQVYDWISQIGLQVKYDIIGSRWLVEILSLAELPNRLFEGDPKFYKYLLQITKDNIWKNSMTSASVNKLRTSMIDFRNTFNAGWKDAYHQFKGVN